MVSPASLPDCPDEMEVHFFSEDPSVLDTWVTTAGELVTTKYGEGYSHGDYCVGKTEEEEVVALMCNPCKKKRPCINLCCPHGQAFLPNADYDYNDYASPSHVCAKTEGELEYRPEVWHREEERILEWERNRDYILVAPGLGRTGNGSVGFHCPAGYGGVTWAPEDIGDFNIISDGSLRGSNLPDYEASEDGSVKRTSIWSPGTYCMIIGSPPDYSDYSEDNEETSEDTSDKMKLTFMHCHKPDEESWEETFSRRFHPTALSISIVFLFLTLIVYAFEEKLRQTLVGKITIGFLMNLACCFIIITDTIIKEGDKSNDRRETFSCIISGYLIMYFFHAFFFWLNAMAFHIWLPFAPCRLPFANISDKNRFLFCLCYAQGLPLIICGITAAVDAAGRGKTYSELQFYPEMGVYSCFLGSQKTSASRSYFTSPVFIYYQSVLILVQISNLVFLTMTWIQMCKAGDGQNQDGNIKDGKRQNFSLFMKLFFILGFHWTADLLSTALAVEHGWQETFYFQLFLDLVNLFSGVLIFLVLICNKPVLSRIQKRLCQDTASAGAEGIQMSVDQEQLSSSARDKEEDTAV